MNFSISNKIKELCEENRISISTLERSLEFSAGLISRWDKNSPSIDKITQVADYFNVSVDSLIGRNLSNDNNSIEVQFIKKIIDDTRKYNIKWVKYHILTENVIRVILEESKKESVGAKSMYMVGCNGMLVWLLEDYDKSFFLYTEIEKEVFVISADSKILNELSSAIADTTSSNRVRDIAIKKMKNYICNSEKTPTYSFNTKDGYDVVAEDTVKYNEGH